MILLILWPATGFLTIYDPGNPFLAPAGGGGGGGGGGETVAYISLPAFTPPPPVVEVVEVPPDETPEVPVVPEPQPVRDSVADSQVVAVNMGTTPGSGTGLSGEGGSGSGVGPGSGTGSGPGSGPGSGGGGSLAKEPHWTRAILYPENPPRELRGKTIQILFWIKADGRVERVEFSPPIANRGYADKFRERLLEFVFSPARSVTGEAIAVQYPIDVSF